MENSVIFKQFSTALNWNAGYYILYKSSFSLRTLLLYKTLSTTDFSVWALINSSIFLLLLWADCGLRKSIPRFAPLFNHSRQSFFRTIIYLQSFILIITLPCTYILLSRVTNHNFLIIIGLGIFISEGLHQTIKHLYHSYFENKRFNTIAMGGSCLEMFLTFSIILIPVTFFHTVQALLLAKLFCSLLITSISLWHMPHMVLPHEIHSQRADLYKPFAIHSLIMWITTVLKSFSERNFLIPLFTQTIGPLEANIFKVANDSALLGYRLILKTIGSADTALLAHIHKEENNNLMAIAVKKIVTRIARLLIPVLGIIGCIIIYTVRLLHYDQFVFHAFLIMAIGYIIETVFIPYERVLEVRRNYVPIFICYIPYIIMMGIFLSGMPITSIGLLPTLTCIHGVRLVSYFLIRYTVYYIYAL